MNITDLKPFDAIFIESLHYTGINVVSRYGDDLKLVPFHYIVDDDNENFEKTHKRAAFRSVSYLNQGHKWNKVGEMHKQNKKFHILGT